MVRTSCLLADGEGNSTGMRFTERREIAVRVLVRVVVQRSDPKKKAACSLPELQRYCNPLVWTGTARCAIFNQRWDGLG